MRRVYSSIIIDASAIECQNSIKRILLDERYHEAYKNLISAKFSDEIIFEEEGKKIVFQERGVEPITRIQIGGWNVGFEFEYIDMEKTKVGIFIEYSTFAAVMGFGTLRYQAMSQIQYLVFAMLAFENGTKVLRNI